MKTAMITGITGQDGSYLTKFLSKKGYRIIGLLRNNKESDLKNLEYLGLNDNNKVRFIKADLLNLTSIIKILDIIDIDEVYNLAAQSSVASSFDRPIETINSNIISAANLLEAIRIINPKIKYYQASSSEMFGNVDKKNLPINKYTAFGPISPYGISKAAAHWITVNYRKSYNMFAVCGICFNHESVLRSKHFVIKKIINSAVKISMGLDKELKLGNLNVYRDWGYALKYVEAMWLMLQQDIPHDYIISSGKAHSLKEFVNNVFERLELDTKKYVKIDKNLCRLIDIQKNYGDNSEAKNKLKWNYNINLKQLIDKLVEDEIQYIKWEASKKI